MSPDRWEAAHRGLASIDVYLDQVRRDISERAKQFLTTCALDGLDGHMRRNAAAGSDN